MKVILAGSNVDRASLPPAREGEATPEAIAAAYARISRSPLPTWELREMARKDVEKARKSNEKIVFEMGHSSIAEHAVFNIDIIGVSRLLVEEIEKFRLVSFTEKSQRYCLFQDDFTLPEELKDSSLADQFIATIRRQQQFYRTAYEQLRSYLSGLNGGPLSPTLDNAAKEDARYAISLATHTQLGMTINARNFELMVRRLSAHPLAEAQKLGYALFENVHPVAPSLIRYVKPTAYDLRYHRQGEFAGTIPSQGKPVNLAWFTPDADRRLIAALLYGLNKGSYEECFAQATKLPKEEGKTIIKDALRHIQAYDQVRREFEIVELTYDLTVSASCFAQLKRHRMATIVSQDYHPALGNTIPPNLLSAGLQEAFLDLIETTNETYDQILKEAPQAAPYILTNSHRRRVLLKVNARELYHMARLRADRHAQWDIRSIVEEMLACARNVMPLTLMLACGRDAFPEAYQSIFSKEES